MTDLTSKELVAELGMAHYRLKEMREKFLTTDDYYTEKNPRGGRPQYFYRATAVEKLRVVQVAGRNVPLAIPEFYWAQAVSRLTNKNYVKCRVWLTDGTVEGARVYIPGKLQKNIFKGRFKVHRIVKADGKRHYRHEKVCSG